MIVGVGVAAHLRPRRAAFVALAVGVALAGLAALAGHGGSSASLLGMGVAVCAAAAALAGLFARLGAPGPAASAVAALTLWVACGGVWWADRLAATVAAPARGPIREAVLAADPLTSAAYALGFDRLHAEDVYEGTLVGSSTVRAPRARDTALAWGALALAAGLASRLLRPRGSAAPAASS